MTLNKTRRQGDRETRRRDRFSLSPCLPVSLSLCLLVSLSPCLLVRAMADDAKAGTITGTIDCPNAVKAIFAVERASKQQFKGSLQGDRFTIAGLPLGKKYDCIIDFGNARLEGVNLKVPRSDYEEEQPLSKDDVAHLKKEVRDLNQFENVVDVLAVEGNIQHAAVLINKLRTTPFYDSKPGEIVWRLELWHFERPEETWVKTQDELWTVFYRERLQKDVYDAKSLTLDPALGGLEPTAKQVTVSVGRVTLPEAKPGVRLRGKVAGK